MAHIPYVDLYIFFIFLICGPLGLYELHKLLQTHLQIIVARSFVLICTRQLAPLPGVLPLENLDLNAAHVLYSLDVSRCASRRRRAQRRLIARRTVSSEKRHSTSCIFCSNQSQRAPSLSAALAILLRRLKGALLSRRPELGLLLQLAWQPLVLTIMSGCFQRSQASSSSRLSFS